MKYILILLLIGCNIKPSEPKPEYSRQEEVVSWNRYSDSLDSIDFNNTDTNLVTFKKNETALQRAKTRKK